jgi:DNA-binding XRE family transcriptional regulator
MKMADTKKPKWGVVTFNQIEKRRKDLTMSKSAMATALGITNSTYHNWQRGTTVPHPAQQDVLKTALDSMNASGAKAPAKKPGPKPKAASNGRKHPERSRAPREHVAGGSAPMQTGFSKAHPFFPPSGQSVPGIDPNSIATITAAYITSQSAKGPVDKQTVFDFISGLQKTMSPTVDLPAPVAAPKVEEPAPTA